MQGIEIGRPKVETTELPSVSQNPIGDGKRPIGDNNRRPIPEEDSDPNFSVHFAPKRSNHNITILDLDCTLDPKKFIDDWKSNIMIALIINKEIIRSETNSWNYVLASTRGNVRAFLETFDFTVKNEIWRDSTANIPSFIKKIVDQIYKQFIRQTYEAFKSERTTITITDALNHLEKIAICNMCYFKNYCREFSKYFYICPKIYWKDLTEKFIRKLPERFNHDVLEMFDQAIKKHNKSTDPRINVMVDTSLGLAITLTRDLLADKCKESHLVKSSRSTIAKNPRICCDKYKSRIPS
ncbi:CCHC-type domain-containing protein [Abeliophyllum distichum]|uniref:CCHC-type domain-containing protein n=1 Tax=Abeliophyllum distichum TaxID=126358 RepID=A0ABD1UQ30_9LAMI